MFTFFFFFFFFFFISDTFFRREAKQILMGMYFMTGQTFFCVLEPNEGHLRYYFMSSVRQWVSFYQICVLQRLSLSGDPIVAM